MLSARWEADDDVMRPRCEATCRKAVEQGAAQEGARCAGTSWRHASAHPLPIFPVGGEIMSSAAQPMSMIDQCGELCLRCARICQQELYRHCLTAGGRHATAPHVQVMTDCSAICQLAAGFLQRGSPRHWEVCGVCASICDDCADSCAGLDGMQACVEACRACAAACRAMVG
jgi:hypothetical protein